MNKEELLAKWGTKIPIGSDGYICLVDVMGGEADIVTAARVSYGDGTKTAREDKGLIRYLLSHHHWTPFEMPMIRCHIQIPNDAWKQWLRHRTASYNEYSTRYSTAILSAQVAESWRLQSSNNKQGSSGELTSWAQVSEEKFINNLLTAGFSEEEASSYWSMFINNVNTQYDDVAEMLSRDEEFLHETARETYIMRLGLGVAREQARKDLPFCNYTRAYFQMNLRNLLGFLRLRMDPHAQQEIREFANVIAEMVKDWVPTVWETFDNYALRSETFSGDQMAMLRGILEMVAESGMSIEDIQSDDWRTMFDEYGITNKSERRDFVLKLKGR